MDSVETTYAVVLEYASDGFLTHIGSLLRRRYGLEQIEEPGCTNVIGKLQHLRIIAPELVPEAVGETTALNLELLVDARPFSELDDNGLSDGKLAESPHIGPEAVRQHIGVTAVVVGAGDREAIAKAVELLGVDRINVEATLEQGLDDRPMRRLDADMDIARLATARLQQPGNHVGETGPTVRELPLSDFLACVVIQRNDMLLRCPINTHQPSSFFVHHALSAAWRHLPAPVDRARKQSEPRRNPSLFLYWRSQAQSPHWALVTAVSPGHESEEGAPQKILAAQEPHGCSRRIGSARKIAS